MFKWCWPEKPQPDASPTSSSHHQVRSLLKLLFLMFIIWHFTGQFPTFMLQMSLLSGTLRRVEGCWHHSLGRATATSVAANRQDHRNRDVRGDPRRHLQRLLHRKMRKCWIKFKVNFLSHFQISGRNIVKHAKNLDGKWSWLHAQKIHKNNCFKA